MGINDKIAELRRILADLEEEDPGEVAAAVVAEHLELHYRDALLREAVRVGYSLKELVEHQNRTVKALEAKLAAARDVIDVVMPSLPTKPEPKPHPSGRYVFRWTDHPAEERQIDGLGRGEHPPIEYRCLHRSAQRELAWRRDSHPAAAPMVRTLFRRVIVVHQDTAHRAPFLHTHARYEYHQADDEARRRHRRQ